MNLKNINPIADHRKEYAHAGLRRADLLPNALEQFKKWLDEALAANVLEATAMTLATADADGAPSARTVLLKGVDKRGFQFFTNFLSRKSQEMTSNPRAGLVLYWRELERQVCVRGTVSRLTRKEAVTYFRTRPAGSRLTTWVSRQTEEVASRDVLEAWLKEVQSRYPTDEIPMPEYWGGFNVEPMEIEFWQGRPNRLHDRFLYRKRLRGWEISRLAP